MLALDAVQSPVAIRRWAGPLRESRAPARHAFTVLAYHVAGELEMEHGARVSLRPGDLHVIPAGHAHRMLAGRDVELWGVGFAAARLDPARFAGVLAPLDAIARGAFPRIAVPVERRPFVASLFTELARERSRSALRGESLLALLLDEVAAHAGALAPVAPTNDLASRAVQLIAARALGPLSLADVADALGKNRTHVAEVVRRATGQTVGALIAELRLDEARRRLEETDELVEVIGERVGYADPTHFARAFKRRHGVPPRAWRRRMLAAWTPR